MEVAAGLLEVRRDRLEIAQENITNQALQQANYVFDSAKYLAFERLLLEELPAIDGDMRDGRYPDLLSELIVLGASELLLKTFDEMIAVRMDNRDMFPWQHENNGLIMNPNLQDVVANLSGLRN